MVSVIKPMIELTPKRAYPTRFYTHAAKSKVGGNVARTRRSDHAANARLAVQKASGAVRRSTCRFEMNRVRAPRGELRNRSDDRGRARTAMVIVERRLELPIGRQAAAVAAPNGQAPLWVNDGAAGGDVNQ